MFEPVIGMEIHAELKTKNKVFSNTLNSFSDQPNKFVNPIDLALPGTLPKLNFEVIEMSLKAALAFNCKINKEMQFDRKNYFYPDLPKGYQITQNRTPIGYDGYVEIDVDGEVKKIRIARLHIEEDTCKSIHDNGTKLNFNRAGVPLIEIVTMPDISSSKEAVLYLEKIRETLLYLGVSDVKMEEGSMRCEANVSIKKIGSTTYGTKVEVKNIGSVTYAGLAIDYEIKRQEEVIEAGNEVLHETRKFDENSKQTVVMRLKESGNDYRYFPEPDLPRFTLEDDYINAVIKKMPLLPDSLRTKYREFGINENNIKTLIGNIDLCIFFEQTIEKTNPNVGVNLLTSSVLSYINKTKKKIEDCISVEDFILITKKRETDEISSSQVKEVFVKYFDGLKLEEILSEFKNNSINIDEVEELIIRVLNQNPASIADYKAGNERALKYLMGQIMKESQGKIDPKLANDTLVTHLDNLH